MTGKWLRSFVYIAAVCIWLTACDSSQTVTTMNPIQQETDLVEEGQTLTVINPEPSLNHTAAGASADEGRKYQIQTRLTDFRLFSSTQGLAWGSTNNELRLYYTQDNGATWTNISPSGSIQFANNPKYGKDLYFIDGAYGWIARAAFGSSETIILRTNDGGLTWKMTSLPESDEVVSIYFLNEQRGWILTKGNTPDRSGNKTVFTTSNGGATWTKIMSTPMIPTGTDSLGEILPKAAEPAGMVFTDELNGHLSLNEAGFPVMYVTTNGGSNWTKNTHFFDSDKFAGCNRFTVGDPTFYYRNGSEGWASVGCGREDEVKFNGYFTEDAGKTWTLAHFILPWQKGRNSKLSPIFINAREGWSLQGSIFYHTTDRGETWTMLPESPKLREVLADYPNVVKIQFHSSKVGWMLVEKDDKKRSLLMQTKDGGASWHVL